MKCMLHLLIPPRSKSLTEKLLIIKLCPFGARPQRSYDRIQGEGRDLKNVSALPNLIESFQNKKKKKV